ncbi:hypothetical protein D3C87_1422430 [compost metagenome]
MLSSSGLVACSQDSFSTVRTASNGGATGGNGSAGGGFPTSCSSTTVGKIYDPAGAASAGFDSQVKAFVSATLNPTLLGSVSGDINAATGIDLKGSWSFDSTGSLVLSGAAVSIEIFDSYVGTKDSNGETILPYTIDFSSASSGSINRSTGQFTVVFRDSYGSITFTGTKGSTYSEGTVTFANTTAVSGYSPASGTLGSFKINNCALIK